MKAKIGFAMKFSFITFLVVILGAFTLGKAPVALSADLPLNEEVYTIQGHVDAVAIGAGVVQGWTTTSTSNLQVTLPAGSIIEKVFLYFGGLEMDGLPLNEATASVNGTGLGTNDPIGYGGGYLTNYRWDATAVVNQGSNQITIQTNASEEHFSHILLIIYSNPTLPVQRVVVNDGLKFFYAEPGYSEATTSFYNVEAGSGKLINAVFAGDTGGLQESISFNGTYAACCSIWDGSTGPFLDIDTLPVTTVSGTNTDRVTTGNDAIAWQLAVLVAGPSAPVSPLTAGNLLIPNAGLNAL